MTDEQFWNELWIYSYKAQIDGYPLGHPRRANFRPIVTAIGNPVNREATLAMVGYEGFSEDDRKLLLTRP